eukprot:gnl/TRDRNA2_/TRDRNA2_165617_c0_seq1.p1 gnl/TRDRNA2_/TRDRNA2_165617_c0~~gnl/TRDRNA2_/TRDRNA2_165617_c0_seq1.p1  ORF type:complete len:134 (+),score=11.99 gnl/TRDRNA2_/TRDRNA2_165617_c0_seq1:142-543(+)
MQIGSRDTDRLIPGRVCVGAFPCPEVWRREGKDAHIGALESLVTFGVSLFVCLEDDEAYVHPELGRPHYVDDLPPTWAGDVHVFATEDGGPFRWDVLADCLETLVQHMQRPSCGPVQRRHSGDNRSVPPQRKM